jgi:hypothetical protein
MSDILDRLFPPQNLSVATMIVKYSEWPYQDESKAECESKILGWFKPAQKRNEQKLAEKESTHEHDMLS